MFRSAAMLTATALSTASAAACSIDDWGGTWTIYAAGIPASSNYQTPYPLACTFPIVVSGETASIPPGTSCFGYGISLTGYLSGAFSGNPCSLVGTFASYPIQQGTISWTLNSNMSVFVGSMSSVGSANYWFFTGVKAD